MKHKQIRNYFLVIAMVLCVLTSVPAQDIKVPDVPGENVILQWNRVLQETLRTAGQQPSTIFPVRSFAMMHAAMFDAVNSIERSYTPYLTLVDENTFSPSLLKT